MTTDSPHTDLRLGSIIKVRWDDDDGWYSCKISRIEPSYTLRSYNPAIPSSDDDTSAGRNTFSGTFCFDPEEDDWKFYYNDIEREKFQIATDELNRGAGGKKVGKIVETIIDEEDDNSGMDIDDDEEKKENAPKRVKKKSIKKKPSSSSPSTTASKTSRSGRAIASSYAPQKDDYSEDSDDELMEKVKSKQTNKRKPQRKASSDDDDAYDNDGDPSSSSSDSDDNNNGSQSSFDDEEDSAPSKIRKTAKQTKTKAKAAPAANATKIKMSDSYSAMNKPSHPSLTLDQIEAEHSYFDPRGSENQAEVLINNFLNEQVNKSEWLLDLAILNDLSVQLQTACSGTDAPAIALNMIAEQYYIAKEGKVSLPFEHAFSCEIEAFKQALIARNTSSSVALYPNIMNLTDEKVIDVYGRVCPIPTVENRGIKQSVENGGKGQSALFVAGTSCKDFSMNNSSRKDLEAKGESGQTFFAAVEYILMFKPQFALFENVLGAPWEKMSEYITGRLKLASSSSSKGVGKGGKKEVKTLIFKRGQKNQYYVEGVPSFFGVKAGSILKGYLVGRKTQVHDIFWSESQAKKKKGKAKAKSNDDIDSEEIIELDALLALNNIVKETATLVFEMETTYCCELVKVDSKEFGIPQTRNRCYLFVYRPDNENINDDLGGYFEAIVNHLKTPLKHDLGAFLNNDDDERVRSFRESIRGPSGVNSRKGITLNQVDMYVTSDANIPHYSIVKVSTGMIGGTILDATADSKALRFDRGQRPVTNWGAGGVVKAPFQWWAELMKIMSQHDLEILEIQSAQAARDTESHHLSSFTWNTSQNPTREHHKTANAGVAGCITPGGIYFLPDKGRFLLSSEKLNIQGIPQSRFLLGNETEVQLSDLAGNAMSLTVVSAMMIAAMTAKSLRKEFLKQNKGEPAVFKRMAKAQKWRLDTSLGGRPSEAVNNFLVKRGKLAIDSKKRKKEEDKDDEAIVTESGELVLKELFKVSTDASCASYHCTCETSGRYSNSSYLTCLVCSISCCKECSPFCCFRGHDIAKLDDVQTDAEKAVGFKAVDVLSKLRSLAPGTVCFTPASFAAIADSERNVTGLEKLPFNLSQIKADREHWKIIYTAKNSAEEALGQLTLYVGKRERSSDDVGLSAELISYVPTSEGVRGTMPVISRLQMFKESSKQVWQMKSSKRVELKVVGSGKSESFRVDLGLTEATVEGQSVHLKGKDDKAFLPGLKVGLVEHVTKKNKKTLTDYGNAKKNGEEFRWKYKDNWKVWPTSLLVTGEAVVNGKYDRANCRSGLNQNCLYVRESKPRLFLLIPPCVNRTGPDVACISTSANFEDLASVIVRLPKSWTPEDALKKDHQVLDKADLVTWLDKDAVKLLSVKQSLVIEAVAKQAKNLKGNPTIDLVRIKSIPKVHTDSLKSRSKPVNKEHVLSFQGVDGAKNMRLINSQFVSSLAKASASHLLDDSYLGMKNDEWKVIEEDDVKWGKCLAILPHRPDPVWTYIPSRERWDRIHLDFDCKQYFTDIQNRPSSWEIALTGTADKNKKTGEELVIRIRPGVVAHMAALPLIEKRAVEADVDVKVEWRIQDVSRQSEPVITPFKIPNCNAMGKTSVELKSPYKLHDHQAKALTVLLALDQGEKAFTEEESVEQQIPGFHLGVGLCAKASREIELPGGVIGDAVGAGKTLLSICLVLDGLEKSRQSRDTKFKSSATLIVVPPGLILQWVNEIKKFTPKSLKINIIAIYDMNDMEKTTHQQLLLADFVITPIDILEGKRVNKTKPSNLAYLKNLEAKSKDPKKESLASKSKSKKNSKVEAVEEEKKEDQFPKLPLYTGTNEIILVRGTLIPYSSENPYGGNNALNSQNRRDTSAYFTHRYKQLLCTSKDEVKDYLETDDTFLEKNRRAGRELIGITEKNVNERPLRCRKSVWGLSGTPLLTSTNRVIELAGLMGGTYLAGATSHWRRLERESARDIFLDGYLEPTMSREYRQLVFDKCQSYLNLAAIRNKGEGLSVKLTTEIRVAKLSQAEGELYIKSQNLGAAKRYDVTISEFDAGAGHVISDFLRQNAKSKERGLALVDIVKEIADRDATTKIVVFAEGKIGGTDAAIRALDEAGLGCTHLDNGDDSSIQYQNEQISWYSQEADHTDVDRKRPRTLVLDFENAAGHNLQASCYNVILFCPLYVGTGGNSQDIVADVSTEQQAIGRVFRQGQSKDVKVWRIQCVGPKGERCVDEEMLSKLTDEGHITEACNSME